MTEQRPLRVFISYSHDTIRHQARVLDLANRLRADGIDAEIDQYNDAPPEGWPRWCEQQIETTDVVLMVCTETYHRRIRGEGKPGTGLGAVWEAVIIRQLLYDAGPISDKFVPILFSDVSPEQIPTPIKGWRYYVVDTEDGYEGLYRRLNGQPRPPRPALGTIRALPARKRRRPEAQAWKAAKAHYQKVPPKWFQWLEYSFHYLENRRDLWPKKVPVAVGELCANGKAKTRVSVSYPRLLSKGRSSTFLFHVYPRAVAEQAQKQIQTLMATRDLEGKSASSERHVGDRIAVGLHCPVITFSPEQVTLRIEDRLNKASFVGIPIESCMPGEHDALAAIVDTQTKDGYESVEFTVKVVDYAFDHVSRPLMSKASSAFFGIVSAGAFVLTSLKEIDVALGLTAGTAAATLTAIVLGWGYLPFHVPKRVERGISV